MVLLGEGRGRSTQDCLGCQMRGRGWTVGINLGGNIWGEKVWGSTGLEVSKGVRRTLGALWTPGSQEWGTRGCRGHSEPAGPMEDACGSSEFLQQKVQSESVLATQAVTVGDRRLDYSPDIP